MRVAAGSPARCAVLALLALLWLLAPARAQAQAYLELVVVADHALFVREGVHTQAFVDAVMTRAAQIYAAELGLSVSVVATIVNDVGDPWTPVPRSGGEVDSDSLLFDFSDWVEANVAVQHDAALLLSGLDFDGSTIGLAFLGGVCSSFQHGIVQTTSATDLDGTISAHELGHLVGMRHDGSNGCPSSGYVMAPTLSSFSPPARFSVCSVAEYEDYRAAGQAPCLDDPPPLFVWRADPYGDCSEPCGGGLQTRSVQCVDGTTGAVVPDASCDPDVRPLAQRSCNEQRCGLLTDSQERCVNEQARHASLVAKEQGRANGRCVKEYVRGPLVADLSRLGGSFSAQQCFAADVKGKVAIRAQRLTDSEQARCTGVDRDGISRRPSFGYVLSTVAIPVARSTPQALAADLLGPAADTSLVFTDEDVSPFDRHGAQCQAELVRRAQALADGLWKQTLIGLRDALNGRDHLGQPVPLPGSGDDLAPLLLARLAADPLGKLDRLQTQLAVRADGRCANPSRPTQLPLPVLFPGVCQAEAQSGVGALALCAGEAVRCRFCAQLAASAALPLDCDTFDDGLSNASCAP